MKYVGNALLVTNGNEQDEKNLIRITRDSVLSLMRKMSVRDPLEKRERLYFRMGQT